MSDENNMFADPSVRDGRNRYTENLENIPASPESDGSTKESPDWDINATTPPARQRSESPEYAAPERRPEPSERPRAEPGERPFRPRERDESESRDRPERPDSNRPDRDGRFDPSERFGGRPDRRVMEEPEEDEDYDNDYDEVEEDGKQPSRFSPKVLIPKFMALDNKRKIIIGAVSLVVIIIVISIIGNIIGAITSAVNTPPPVAIETSSTPVPTKTAEPAPVEDDPSQWSPILAVGVGERGVTIDGAEFTIDDVKCDVQAKNRNGSVVESTNGTWCVANFTAKNVSDSILTISSQRFVATDIYGENSYMGDSKYGDVGGGNVISKIAPKESLSGFVYFDVPLGTEISSLKVSTFGNTGGSPINVEVQSVRVPASSPTPTPGATTSPTPTPTPSN